MIMQAEKYHNKRISAICKVESEESWTRSGENEMECSSSSSEATKKRQILVFVAPTGNLHAVTGQMWERKDLTPCLTSKQFCRATPAPGLPMRWVEAQLQLS